MKTRFSAWLFAKTSVHITMLQVSKTQRRIGFSQRFHETKLQNELQQVC